MAASATQVSRTVPGAKFYYDFDLVGDNSYPTGGYDVSSASFWGLNAINQIIPICFTAGMASGVSDFQFTRATGKLMLFTAAGAQVSNGADMSAVKIKVQVHGS